MEASMTELRPSFTYRLVDQLDGVTLPNSVTDG